MKRNLTILLFGLLFINLNCSSDKINTPNTQLEERKTTPLSSTAETTILVFKKEEIAKIWMGGKLIHQITIKSQELAIGIFDYEIKNGQIQFHFPNDFYKCKGDYPPSEIKVEIPEDLVKALSIGNQGRLIVAPNMGNFEACIQCPYWMAELYSQLSFELKKFRL